MEYKTLDNDEKHIYLLLQWNLGYSYAGYRINGNIFKIFNRYDYKKIEKILGNVEKFKEGAILSMTNWSFEYNYGYAMTQEEIKEEMQGYSSFLNLVKLYVQKRKTLKAIPSYVAGKRVTKSIFDQHTKLPLELKKDMKKYFGFGKKRTIKHKKELSKALKNQAKKYKVKLTVKRNGKRVYKTEKVLKKQISNAKK